MSHFHILVFNCEPISLFLDKFDKINNFPPEPDKLYILEASFNHKQEQEKVAKIGKIKNDGYGSLNQFRNYERH